jgi:hypothetical protein
MKNLDRTDRIPVPVSPAEKATIVSKAHQANMTVAEFMRFLALNFVPAPTKEKQP